LSNKKEGYKDILKRSKFAKASRGLTNNKEFYEEKLRK
jgi:hypothetical protein